MKEIRKLPATAGAQWLLDTFTMYGRAPLQLARLGLVGLMVTWLATLLAVVLPTFMGLVVQVLSLAITPLLFGGMLYAIGEIDHGRQGLPAHLLQPIRNHRVSHLLVPMAIYLLAIILLGALLYTMIGQAGFAAFGNVWNKMQVLAQSGQPMSQDEAMTLMADLPVKRILLWVVLVMCTMVALIMAMFTQPALVVFDRQSGMHALRLSLQGCMENIGAVLVFTVLGLITGFFTYLGLTLVTGVAILVGGPVVAAFLGQLITYTVFMPLYVGAVYAAWKQMFAHRGRAPELPESGRSDIFHA
ncbi:BPSS1780 family membrane protein [Stenotrophomonas sp. 24(2023)]|uniref:BPSS1780 family membrane protein n=1 Tax=Stenotrophomonas sp. 24(2023) TaxID=3068324 RepID=UPI0027E05214|nr:BPSS1780 family membrane protein [Stenotrophomonas sp. 24(2023)]WMJ71018.1 BPSS1780 family membrane protein [Stenotrophomonas sp. 24(2023)]